MEKKSSGLPKHDRETKNLINLYKQKKYVEMERMALSVLARNPTHSYARRAVGASLVGQRRYKEAIPVIAELLRLKPDDWEMWTNIGAAKHFIGDLSGAVLAFIEAVEINPECAPAYNALAALYRDTSDFAQALKASYEALKCSPENREYFIDWVQSLIRLKHNQEAMESLRAAWEDDPADAELASLMIKPARSLADWTNTQIGEKVFLQRFHDGVFDDLGSLGVVATAQMSRQEQREFIYAHSAEKLDYPAGLYKTRLAGKTLNPNKTTLRIGYLSADFHSHATMMLAAGVFDLHQEFGLELYAYSNGPESDDPYRHRILKAAKKFRDVRCLSPEQTVEYILEDEIDILVDLKGWTLDYHMGIPAMQPAPITACWLGFPGTIGNERLGDYIIGDPIVTPLEHADGYSETLALMPHSYQPNDNSKTIAEVPSKASVGLPTEGFVFCSFNRVDKLNPPVFEVWCELLRETPGSVLWLYEANASAQQNLRNEAQIRGVSGDRLIFSEFAQTEQHLARLQLADLALDTFPYGSHTTGSDALWAGVPLLALEGQTFASRVSSSLVHAVGLPELVARSFSEYRDLGLKLAKNPAMLKQIRQKLNDTKQTAPLFDTRRFARDLARMYQKMWSNFVNGTREPIILEALPLE